MWRWAEKNEGGISAPSETCKDIETDTAISCIHVYDGHESNRCLQTEKKIRLVDFGAMQDSWPFPNRVPAARLNSPPHE